MVEVEDFGDGLVNPNHECCQEFQRMLK